MTTGKKLALLREKKGITQEKLSEILNVSRQSVSRWETDISFPETDKLIILSKYFECSIDFLLNEDIQENEANYLQNTY
ncbi:MAG: helix-turn-helix domain-containing protein [Lachnospiraceae bacterium]|nr:helix-turn-helix domain-containing protein [Lachnospiraceae bacterium]